MAKITLERQVAELRALLREREPEMRRKVAKREMRQAEAEYRLETLLAAIDTMEWLLVNRQAVVAAYADALAAVKAEEGA